MRPAQDELWRSRPARSADGQIQHGKARAGAGCTSAFSLVSIEEATHALRAQHSWRDIFATARS
jgi:hypothetical protein